MTSPPPRPAAPSQGPGSPHPEKDPPGRSTQVSGGQASPLAASLAGGQASPLAASLVLAPASRAAPALGVEIVEPALAPGVEAARPSPAVLGAATARPGRTSAVLPGPVSELQLAATVADSRRGAALAVGVERARYEPIRELGEGSFGQVLLVQDNDIARPVAMKRLKSEWHQGETLARFVDEIQAIGQLEHPGIVPIHDVGLDERGYYFIMKYVEGETLEQIIEKLRAGDAAHVARFSYEVRVAIFLQVLRALQFAHARGVLHRDIKPANVMVGPYGEVMLMDWGLARRQDAPLSGPPTRFVSVAAPGSRAEPLAPMSSRMTQTQSGAVVGSPAYMSPEQARGDLAAVDARSDVYSLSALFYELLTLDHYLTPKQTMEQLIEAVSREQPLTAVGIHHRYGVPPEYTFYVRRGLSKDPAQRFQSVEEMAEALQAITSGEIPVQCPCTGLKAAGNRWFDFIDAHPIAAVTAAILTSGAALFGVVDLALRLVHSLRG